MIITGRLELSEDNPPSIIADQLQSLDDVQRAKELIVLRVPTADDASELFDNLLHVINTHSGGCEVILETEVESNLLVRVKVNSSLKVERSDSLEAAVRKVGCGLSVERF